MSSARTDDSKTPLRLAVLTAAFLVLAVLAHYGGLAELVKRWSSQEEYSHGFFIPALSAWILWNRRDAVLETLGNGTSFGYVVLIPTLLVLAIGELSALFILVQLSFIASLAGFALLVGGWRLLQLASFPIAFLIFAIPLPYFIDSTLSWRMQLVSSAWGVGFLRVFNIPVFLQGNVIDLGLYQLQVVEACSGLRYLYPLMSLGVLAAYLFKAPLWQRILIFLSTIPITILMNSFRIGMIGVSVNIWGIEMAEGALHFFEGWVIFMTCALLLFAEIWLLNRLNGRKDVFNYIGFPPPADNTPLPQFFSRAAKPAMAACGLVAVAVLGLQFLDNRVETLPKRQPLASFPLVLDGWSAQERSLDPLVESALGVDDYILANFSKERNAPVNFYVAFYESQRKGTSPHSPRVCIPGGGWEIAQFERSAVSLDGPGRALPINRLVIEREREKLLVYYWFDQRGKAFANEYKMKAHLLLDAVSINRTDGALVRVTTPLAAGESLEAADERLASFVRSVNPYLPRYIPGKSA